MKEPVDFGTVIEIGGIPMVVCSAETCSDTDTGLSTLKLELLFHSKSPEPKLQQLTVTMQKNQAAFIHKALDITKASVINLEE